MLTNKTYCKAVLAVLMSYFCPYCSCNTYLFILFRVDCKVHNTHGDCHWCFWKLLEQFHCDKLFIGSCADRCTWMSRHISHTYVCVTESSFNFFFMQHCLYALLNPSELVTILKLWLLWRGCKWVPACCLWASNGSRGFRESAINLDNLSAINYIL